MPHSFDELTFTVARQISADRVKRYLVWTRRGARGAAVACHLYEAPSSAEALRLARRELENWEAAMSAV
jgi:hypothetical protein